MIFDLRLARYYGAQGVVVLVETVSRKLKNLYYQYTSCFGYCQIVSTNSILLGSFLLYMFLLLVLLFFWDFSVLLFISHAYSFGMCGNIFINA